AESAAMRNVRLADRTNVGALADLDNVCTSRGTILGGAISSTEIDTFLMSMHMAGSCSHLQAVPTPVELDGRTVLVPAVPMLGGGSIIRGTSDEPVRMECCFVGSNAIVEPGTFVGFGCFVLGRLEHGAGLLPFTISTGCGPRRHRIGWVLSALSSTVITHFINWTYQAVGPQGAPAVAEMIRQSMLRAIAAIEAELARRSHPIDSEARARTPYHSLGDYSTKHLEDGLNQYRRNLDSGAWEMVCHDEQLWFSSDKGRWIERGGSAIWKAF
ncbi:MAG: hypothetical protein J7M14_05545, partial [Planctomycetes bacterium]|nr:hypothetical protein [Planctomycetota bacterium]